MSTDVEVEHFVRTTVSIREDYYQRLRADPRGMSEALNDILARRFKRDHSMFGSLPAMDLADLRDKEDRL